MLDSSSNLVATYTYDAYGNLLNKDSLSYIGLSNSLIYKGYLYLHSLSWYYLTTRFYIPSICRFLTPDSSDYLEISSVGGLNLYAYCKNDPVNGYDPSGHITLFVLVAILTAVSFAVGFTASTVSQGITYGWDKINYWQSAVDGLFAAGSTALAATGIGMIGSIFVGGAMGAAQYAIDSKVFHDDFSWSGFATSIGIGMIGGWISGRGASNPTAISKCNLNLDARTGIKALLTAACKYGPESVEYARVFNIWGNRVFSAISSAVCKNFVKSAAKIYLYTIVSYAPSYITGMFSI